MTEQRIVLVTGAAQGLGQGIAEKFASHGDKVIIADINGDQLAETATQLGVESHQLDISNRDNICAVVNKIANQYGRIDVLVNNAGIVGGHGQVTELDSAVFEKALMVNVLGTWMMSEAVGKLMVAAKKGAIVNISSIGGRQPTPGMGHYEATKAAVDAITRTTAIELAPFGIRANAVAPGPVITPLTAGFAENPEAKAMWEARIPLRQIAEVTQVAPAAYFLASDEASHITGVSLAVDGGQLLT